MTVTIDDVINEINELLWRKSSNNINRIYVTEVSRCLRRSFYERQYRYRLSIRQIEGSLTHELLSVIASRLGCRAEVKCEKEIKKGIYLVGRIDLVCNEEHSDKSFIVEFKTSNNPNIYDYHIRQTQAYMHITGIPVAYVVIIGDSFIKTYEIEYEPEAGVDIEVRAFELHKALKNNIEPKKEPSGLCRYCPFYHVCNYGGLDKWRK